MRNANRIIGVRWWWRRRLRLPSSIFIFSIILLLPPSLLLLLLLLLLSTTTTTASAASLFTEQGLYWTEFYGWGPSIYGEAVFNTANQIISEPTLCTWFGDNGIVVRRFHMGPRTSYAITQNGTYYWWGSCHAKQCGAWQTSSVFPQLGVFPNDTQPNIVSIAAGSSSVLLLTDQGILYYSGITSATWTFTELVYFKERGIQFVKLYSSPDNYILVSATNAVYVVRGLNSVQTPLTYSVFQQFDYIPLQKICAGQNHFVALTGYGDVYVWGSGNNGELGMGPNVNSTANPTMLKSFPNNTILRDIRCGLQFTLALSDRGEVYGWGSNDMGQLGNGNLTDVHVPTLISFFSRREGDEDITIRAISAGYTFSHAITSDGVVYSWGDNRLGQLGLGVNATLQYPYIPVPTVLRRLQGDDEQPVFFPSDTVFYARNHTFLVMPGVTCKGRSIHDPLACSGPEHGYCQEDGTCECNEDWTGAECEKPVVYCFDIPSSSPELVCSGGRGVCIRNDTCECFHDYYGAQCEHSWGGPPYNSDSSGNSGDDNDDSDPGGSDSLLPPEENTSSRVPGEQEQSFPDDDSPRHSDSEPSAETGDSMSSGGDSDTEEHILGGATNVRFLVIFLAVGAVLVCVVLLLSRTIVFVLIGCQQLQRYQRLIDGASRIND